MVDKLILNVLGLLVLVPFLLLLCYFVAGSSWPVMLGSAMWAGHRFAKPGNELATSRRVMLKAQEDAARARMKAEVAREVEQETQADTARKLSTLMNNWRQA